MTEVPGDGASGNEAELAERLLLEWDEGRGVSKSQLELRVWGDATSHGRHFDRFVRAALGVSTSRPPRPTGRIADLERQVRALGGVPVGPGAGESPAWEVPLQHAREACLAALRVWNDPAVRFRAGTFSLLFVAAWHSLAIAVAKRHDGEAQELDEDVLVGEVFAGTERSRPSWPRRWRNMSCCPFGKWDLVGNFSATYVIAEVERRTGRKLSPQLHADAARHLGARPPKGEGERTVDLRFAEYISSFKRYLYSQSWIDHLAARLAGADSSVPQLPLVPGRAGVGADS